MVLSPGITKKLMQATSDKADLSKQALRLSRSFREMSKVLGTDSKAKDRKGK